MDFWKSKEWQELSGLLTTAYLPGPTVGGQYLGLLSVRTPDGKMVLAAAVFDDIYPGSNPNRNHRREVAGEAKKHQRTVP